jgi:hypothetical protein
MLIKLAEHASLYQYSLVNAQNHYIGFAQTETVWADFRIKTIPSDAA